MDQGSVLAGEIFKAFPRASAVAISSVKDICRGCTLYIEGFGHQVVSSIEVNRNPVPGVKAGTAFGLLINSPEFTFSSLRKELIAREKRAERYKEPAKGIKVFLLIADEKAEQSTPTEKERV